MILDDCPAEVVTDPGKLRQILVNLLGNAVKFTDQGEVELRVWTEPESVCFRVTDTGPGIPARVPGPIFEPFTQVDSTHTRAKGGTGLGLPVSRRLARLLGGDLEVASASGREPVYRDDPSSPTAPPGRGALTGQMVESSERPGRVRVDAAGLPGGYRTTLWMEAPPRRPEMAGAVGSKPPYWTAAGAAGRRTSISRRGGAAGRRRAAHVQTEPVPPFGDRLRFVFRGVRMGKLRRTAIRGRSRT